jgi:hypothetical protein
MGVKFISDQTLPGAMLASVAMPKLDVKKNWPGLESGNVPTQML